MSILDITSLPQVAEILPYLLGHYPDDSITLHAPGPNFHDGPTMTCPLPENPAEWQTAAENAARQFVAHAHHEGHNPDQGVIIYLCREPRPDQSPQETAALLAPLTDWFTDTLTELRANILQTFGLVANRWWAYDCPTEGCCEGEPLPSPQDPTSITAQMARLGKTPPPRTRDILKEFRTTADPDFLQDLHAAAARFNARCATSSGCDATLLTTCTQIDAAINQFRNGATSLTRSLTAQLICGLQDDGAVDAGMAQAEDEDLPHARRLWAYLAQHCAEPFTQEATTILALFAFVAWRQGDIIAARLALRDAITTDPDNELAIDIHLGMTDNEDPRAFLYAAHVSQDQRIPHLQHVEQISSEYRPTDTNADRYRKALDSATADYAVQALSKEEKALARHGTADIIDAALANIRNGRPQLTDDIAARIIIGLQDRHARDLALSDGEEADLPHERHLWSYLARLCVPPHTDKTPALLTLLGWVAWRQGDIITAAHTLAEALTVEPDYSLAQTLLDALRTEGDPNGLLAALRNEKSRSAANRSDLDTL